MLARLKAKITLGLRTLSHPSTARIAELIPRKYHVRVLLSVCRECSDRPQGIKLDGDRLR